VFHLTSETHDLIMTVRVRNVSYVSNRLCGLYIWAV